MSHKIAVLFRWMMAAQIWMVAIAAWDANHLPSNVAHNGLTPLDMLGVTTAAIAWHALILLAGLVAEYGLIVCGPLWVGSEVVAWSVCRENEEKPTLAQMDEMTERAKHGWVPR